MRAKLEDLAGTLHASYVQRWGRYDPKGLERAQRPGQGRAAGAA